MIAVACFDEIDSLPPLLEAEVVEIASVKNEKRRREMTLTRRLVKKLLGHGVTVGHRRNGSPYAVGFEGSLSVSHSRDVAAVVYDPDMATGVDVEFPSPALQRVATKFLSRNELQIYTGMALLLKAWTIKEAVYKAAQIDGLSLFDIHLPDDVDEAVATVTHCEREMRFDLQFISEMPMITVAKVCADD